MFCKEQAMKIIEDQRLYLTYLVAYAVSKQVVKVLGYERVCLVYLVVCINEFAIKY